MAAFAVYLPAARAPVYSRVMVAGARPIFKPTNTIAVTEGGNAANAGTTTKIVPAPTTTPRE